jgi:hypothetical protein
MPQYAPLPGQRPTEHRRNKSAGVLKAIMTPKPHKRSPSDGTPLSKPRDYNYIESSPTKTPQVGMSILPPDHPHSTQRVLGEIQNSHNNGAPEKKSKGLHKKTKSVVSLRSLGRDKEKGTEDVESHKEDKKKVKGSKSGANLAAMFSKQRSPTKNLDRQTKGSPPELKDKENTTPPSSAIPDQPQTPIWAQFATQHMEETTTTTVPLNDHTAIEREIARYSTNDYSPSKQRNFYDNQPPSLVPKGARPKSMMVLPSSQAGSMFKDATRKISDEISRRSGDASRKSSTESAPKAASRASPQKSAPDTDMAKKRGSRVMAAVAAFNNKSKSTDVTEAPTKLDPKALDAAFEALMDARNVSGETREKLRTLAPHVKEDFLRKDQVEAPVSPTKPITDSKPGSRDKSTHRRPTWGRSGKSSDGDGKKDDTATTDSSDAMSQGKRGRPRSRTFTFHKGDSSPTKKQKGDMVGVVGRPKSIEIHKSPSSKSLASLASPGGSQIWGSSKQQTPPEDFVKYLRKEQKPEKVEVGKIHKLRLLLRNETVAWVDNFIELGGMKEITDLLHRIMAIEWR